MPLELVEPGLFQLKPKLAEDEASLSKSGELTLRAETWGLVNGGERAAVLIDKELLVLCIRPGREGEKTYPMHPLLNKKKKPTGKVQANVARAVKRLALTTEAVAGRWPLSVKKDALFVHFGGKPNAKAGT